LLNMGGKAPQRFSWRSITEIAILVSVTLLVASNWFNPALPKGHDAVADISVAEAARQAIFGYHLIPGWVDHWYLGYPLFFVSPPLINLLRIGLSLPLGWVVASKLLYGLFFGLSGVFAYYYVHRITGNRYASFIAGLVYTFSSFHLTEVVFEGHYGIGAAYMLIPLVLLSLEKAIKGWATRDIAIAGILVALLTLTHPQAFPLLVGPFLVLFCLFHFCLAARQQKGRVLLSSLSVFSLGLLLSAFWWSPLFGEIGHFHSVEFSDLPPYNPTFLQMISLRPISSCCAPFTTFAASGSIFIQILQLFPTVLAFLGLLLNYKNKYAWFFVIAALGGIFLAWGPTSPINLYGAASDYWPFFDRIRTPQRFLLFTCFAYAALAGLGVKSIVDRVKKPRPSVIIVVILSLLVVANTWQEGREAFESFELTPDQEQAIEWLSEQDEGRLMVLPPQTWIYSPQLRNIVNPMCYTWLHGKQTVHGGTPALAPKWTGAFLEEIYSHWTTESQPTNIGGVLDVLGAKYVVIDKTAPASACYVLDSSFTKHWESETIDIYRHDDPYPRIFATVPTHQETITGGDKVMREGNQDIEITRSSDYVKVGDWSWKVDCTFNKKGQDRFAVGIAVHLPQDTTTVSFWYYLPQSLPQAMLGVHLRELDNSKYFHNPIADMSAGWHEVEVPLSMVYSRWSTDENMRLDKSQVADIWLGVYETKDDENPSSFSIYFSQVSLHSERIEGVDFTLIQPGKYHLQLNSTQPLRLVLAESYYPGWVAKIDNKVIPSERTYGFLNGWHLNETGEYDLILEFTKSGQRKLGQGLTLLTMIGMLLLFVSRRVKTKWLIKFTHHISTG